MREEKSWRVQQQYISSGCRVEWTWDTIKSTTETQEQDSKSSSLGLRALAPWAFLQFWIISSTYNDHNCNKIVVTRQICTRPSFPVGSKSRGICAFWATITNTSANSGFQRCISLACCYSCLSFHWTVLIGLLFHRISLGLYCPFNPWQQHNQYFCPHNRSLCLRFPKRCYGLRPARRYIIEGRKMMAPVQSRTAPGPLTTTHNEWQNQEMIRSFDRRR